MPRRKRKLTESEVSEIQAWFESSPLHAKPTIRQIAKRYNVNQPSVVKSLGNWKGIQRGRPVPPPKPKYDNITLDKESPVKIQGYTEEMDLPNV